jgi:ankyrin repeat protein
MFDLLLDAGANVDGDNTAYDRWSPLMLADSRDRVDMRDELLRRGARVGLFEALMFGDDARLEELLAAVGRLPETVPNAGSPLNFARTTFAIDRLLDFGASIDTPDRWGATPLRSLSRLGTAARPLVRHLIARGACGEPEDYARLGDRQPLEELAASDPNGVRSDAVMMAAVDGGHRDLAAWLLARGASVNARALPPSRHTALHAAAWNGDLPMVELLVNAGADLGARDDEHDNTPLGWARTAIEIRNNPAGQPVVDYLARLESKESGNETGEETT